MSSEQVADETNRNKQGVMLSDQTIIIGMAANPVPHHAILLHDRQSSVLKTDPGRVDILLALQLLELQAGVRRVAPKQPIRPSSRSLHVTGQDG
jgi:hypothetical protein